MKRREILAIMAVAVSFCAMANADVLNISSGETVLSAGTYTYDYVSITGGSLKLVGDVNIICNGKGTAYFNFSSGTIYCQKATSTYAYSSCGNGEAGADGNDFMGGHPTCDGKTGGTGPACQPADVNNGYTLKVYANGDITIKGTIELKGDDGFHNSMGGVGGTGGQGGDVFRSTTNVIAGYGGIGGKGADSVGGKGGRGGNLWLETHGGKIDCGNAASHGTINLKGGNGGNGGVGGTGGCGGLGGNLIASMNYQGTPGTGGNGGRGGNSIGGTGGTGGAITFRALQIIDADLSKDISGGGAGSYTAGGSGGAGGLGGLYPGSSGTRAAPGTMGAAGTVVPGVVGTSGSYSKTIITEPNSCAQAIAMGFKNAADLNKDCYVDFKDMVELSENWIKCNDPEDENCWKSWRDIY
jgi:hypothetical protein